MALPGQSVRPSDLDPTTPWESPYLKEKTDPTLEDAVDHKDKAVEETYDDYDVFVVIYSLHTISG